MEDFKKQLSFLELFIIDTICYFDVFDYPLTLIELYNYLYTNGMEGEEYTVEEVKDCLAQSPALIKIIKNTGGFFHLAGRSSLVDKRQERYLNSIAKIKIAQRAIKYLSRLPFVSFIGLCNNLSINNAEADSDIDFFIVTKSGRLYVSRLLITLLLSVLGLRRHDDKINNRICLSFYVAENSLDLRPLLLDRNDIYFVYWLSWILPLYDNGGYNKFRNENYWIKQYLPNLKWEAVINYSVLNQKSAEKIFSGRLGDWLEKICRGLQNYKMSLNKNSLASKRDTRVVINSDILKFHENDRREYYRGLFEEKQREILKNI